MAQSELHFEDKFPPPPPKKKREMGVLFHNMRSKKLGQNLSSILAIYPGKCCPLCTMAPKGTLDFCLLLFGQCLHLGTLFTAAKGNTKDPPRSHWRRLRENATNLPFPPPSFSKIVKINREPRMFCSICNVFYTFSCHPSLYP